MWKIRQVKAEDLPLLTKVEQQCFPVEEAATKEAFAKRIELISDSFFVAEQEEEIMGLINGPVIHTAMITDDLFTDIQKNPVSGGHQSVLGVAVSPKFQKQGVAAALFSHLEKEARARSRESITLTCKENLIPFYENFGYKNAGISNSVHGGVTWYNMIKILQ